MALADCIALDENTVYRIDKIDYVESEYLLHLSYKDKNLIKRLHLRLPRDLIEKFIGKVDMFNTVFFSKETEYTVEFGLRFNLEFWIANGYRQKTIVHPLVRRSLDM